MALELNKNGFIDNSSCNRQSICILIDNSENVEPRIKDMIYESIELLFAKMKEQKSLIGRMDLAFVLLNRDEKDNIDFCPLQQSVLPDLMVKSQNLQSDSLKAGFLKAMYLLRKQRNEYRMKEISYYMPWIIYFGDENKLVELEEVEQEIQSRIENDELRVYSILLDKKGEEYFSSYMDCSNTYFADASNRLAKVMEQLIDNMNMVSKSSERARIGYEKSYHGTISWERASKIAQKKLK